VNNYQAELGRLRQLVYCLKGWCHHQDGGRWCPGSNDLCRQCLSVVCMCNVPQFRILDEHGRRTRPAKRPEEAG
jgi:hypothetical protein